MAHPATDDGGLPLIKVVGASGSGKSTLVSGLRRAGYNARPVSQEHSNIPDLWQQFDRPAVLIFLDVDIESQRRRRPDVTWTDEALFTERQRLAHARDHADLRINTSALSPERVLALVLAYLRHARIRHADHPLEPVPATGGAHRPASPAS